MKNSNWKQYFQISSNLAVLAGVILVVLQLKQSTDLLELQILKQDSDSYSASALETLPENFDEIHYKAVESPEDLTGAEIMSLDKYYWGRQVARWRGLYDLAERGLLDDDSWRRAIREDAAILYHPFGRAWWRGIKNWETTLPADLVALVDEELLSSNHEPQLQYLQGLRRRVQEEIKKSN